MNKLIKLFYREIDGHFYVLSDMDGWISFPCYADGTPDLLAPMHEDEIKLNANKEDWKQLQIWLEEKEKEIGVKDFDVNDPIYWKEENEN